MPRAAPLALLEGWQTNSRRRLGDSGETRPSYGPPMSSDEIMSGLSGLFRVLAAPDRDRIRSQSLEREVVGLDDRRNRLPHARLHRHTHLQPIVAVRERASGLDVIATADGPFTGS